MKRWLIVLISLEILLLAMLTRTLPAGSGSPPHSLSLPTATSAPSHTPSRPQPQDYAALEQSSVAQSRGGAESNAYHYTFDGSPPVAQPWRPPDWDVVVHSQESSAWKRLDAVDAHHGADCSAPPATHTISAYEEAVFQCKDHVMTSINGAGYGMIYLTPNHLVDFSGGEATIRFDVSTLSTSQRDWIDLWVTPFQANLQLPLDQSLPDLQGEPSNAVHVRMTPAADGTRFMAEVVRNFVGKEVPARGMRGYETFLVPDVKRRDTFELRLSPTHIAFGMPDHNYWWIDSPIGDLGWDSGIVQIGHHSYNPMKGCTGCQPNTWHWDNLQISPALPFTMINANERFVDTQRTGALSFPDLAPANAYLRFAAFGNNIELSFDGGASWHPAKKQAQEKDNQYHFRSYWTPVPEGMAKLLVRGAGISNYGWHARDFAIWAR